MKEVLAFVVALLIARPAAAADAYGSRVSESVRGEVDADSARAEGDGAYGRFDGDVDLGLAAGANLSLTSKDVGVGARVNALWYFSAGPYLSYAERVSGDRESNRRGGLGFELRPLFLPRWALDLERGPAFFDLTLDSLSVSFGAFLATPREGGFGERRGMELGAGLGVPLLAEAPGPWLEVRALLDLPNDGPREALLTLSFAYHFALLSPLARN
jgi:hypothetical protein